MRRAVALWAGLGASALGAGWLYFQRGEILSALCREDGPVESLTALSYLLASALFLRAAAAVRFRNLWAWGYALLFFLVAGEEVSWGQRLWDLPTPEELRALNVQGELNLHNLDGVSQSVRAAGLMVVLAICYFAPWTARLSPGAKELALKLRIPLFPSWASSAVTLGLVFMVAPRLFGQVVFELDELGELYLSLGFLCFGLAALPQLTPRPSSSAAVSG